MAVNRKKVVTAVGSALAPRLVEIAPGVTTGFVKQALHRAIHGAGPLPGAAAAAEKQLEDHHGDVDKAIREIIEHHVAYASVGGFVTNLGGLVTAGVTIPTNVTGLALIQCRMVAAIAALRGYDLDDPRVRNAILLCLLGKEKVDRQVRNRRIPAPPMAVATAPIGDPDLDRKVTAEVAAELLNRVAGKRLVTTVGRRIPVVGGAVGAGTDGLATYLIGRYASGELLPRARR